MGATADVGNIQAIWNPDPHACTLAGNDSLHSRTLSKVHPQLHRALLWKGGPESSVECHLCSHRCRIPPSKTGICGVRVNDGGVLRTAAYGRLIAQHSDPMEKKPLYHFLPGTRSYSIATMGCNFRCQFCQNWQISQVSPGPEPSDVRPGTLPGEDVSPEEVVNRAEAAECRSIAYTYTEPTIFFEFARDVGRIAHRRGLYNLFVTNGYQTAETAEQMVGLIDAANVDLKSFSDDYYRRVCKAKLGPVLETIRRLFENRIHLEVTTLVVPGLNDSRKELGRIASFIASVDPGIPWHVSRFHPDYRMPDLTPTPMPTIESALQIGKERGLSFVYSGNVPGGSSDTRCPSCSRVLIQRRLLGAPKIDLDGNSCPNCGRPFPSIFLARP